MQTYRFGANKIDVDDPRLPGILKALHPKKERPLCLCKGDPGIPMYIAQVGQRFDIKRMPNTGPKHAPDCESFEAPEELSGLGQVMGSAIQENTEAGITTLKLDFSLSKGSTRAAPTPSDSEKDSVRTDGTKLTLRSTLHYLWEQAGFNRYSPAMEGKRNWGVIRKYLSQAADGKITKGKSFEDLLYIPETFSTERKAEIEQRRIARLMRHAAQSEKRSLMILIGEVKEIAPSRHGHKIVVKHLPDYHFMMPEDLHKRLMKRFETEIGLSDASDGAKLIVIGTFSVSSAGVANLEEVALMTVTEQWIPFETLYDKMLIDALVKNKRRFIKSLRYNLPSKKPLANVVLTDIRDTLTAVYIIPPDAPEEFRTELQALIDGSADTTEWVWDATEVLPELPT